MKRASIVAGIVAAAVLLAACSSSSDTASSTTAAATSAVSSSPISSTAASSSAASSTAAASSLSATSTSAITIGGDTTELDAQTATWFDTFCTGMGPLGELQSGASSISSVQQLSEQMTSIGTALTDTGAKLAVLPPPTFEGGDQVAQQLQANMQQGGPVFTEYGQKALQLDPNDQAAGNQFLADFQTATAGLGIANFEPTPEVRQAVRAVPACQTLFGS
jgi:hypothetical protein